ncbi:Deoxyribonuclease-1-like 2 [Mactra antiquata]
MAFKLIFCIVCMHTLYATGFILGGSGGTHLTGLAEQPLRIGSFNIQVFGTSKIAHLDVVDILIKILSRYDVVQVLEIRDATQTAFNTLQADLNKYMNIHEPGVVYKSVVSGRLGRTNSKEQYGFLYRASRVSVTGTYQYTDIHDYFEREPFGVRFHSSSTEVNDFVMIATHIQPSMAAEEMDNLTRVYESFKRHWHTSNMIIAGDFNADCNYLRLSDWKTISLRTDTRFEWLLDDDVDTTVATSACSYDRFVVAGQALQDAVVRNSLQAYRFDEIMRISKDLALQVSDHYPIEMELAGKPNMAVQQSIDTFVSFTVRDKTDVSDINNIRAIYRTPSCSGTAFDIKVLREDTHMDYAQAVYTSSTTDTIMSALIQLSKDCPGTLSIELLTMVQGYMEANFLTQVHPGVYGLAYDIQKHLYTTTIKCSLVTPYVCEVTLTKNVS